jgi:hypothetical protein
MLLSNMSSSRHPETDGVTERVNIMYSQLLRYFCSYDSLRWTNMLPLVEFAYNATRPLGIEHTPFEANFGFSPKEPPYMSFCMWPSVRIKGHAVTTTISESITSLMCASSRDLDDGENICYS